MKLAHRMWWAALAWTLVVVIATVMVIRYEQENHRQQALDTAGHRLDSISESLTVTFQQLSALPRALGREESMRDFARNTSVPDSASITEADRSRVRELLMARASVRQMSQTLKETTRDFNLSEILLLDRFGTDLADSAYDTPASPVGGNYKTRSYFTDALDHGVGVQFAVGRVSRIPGFYFAGRIDNENGQTLGVLVIKQEPKAMARLFDDDKRAIFVTDASGVVIMGNQADWVLKHAALRGPMALSQAAQATVYHAPVPALPWTLSNVTVGGRDVTEVRIGEQRYLAQQRNLMGDAYTAWVLSPLNSESTLMGGWMAAGALALVLGYWALAMLTQREKRMATLRKGQQDLNDMAHALPLAVFRYEQSPGGEGRFAFLSKTVQNVLGQMPQTLEEDPQLAWRMAGRGEDHPPTRPLEMSIQIEGRTRWLRCLSTPNRHADGSVTYNGYWLDITEQKEQVTQSQSVFRSAPNAYLFFDADMGIQRANPAAMRIFDAPSEQALLGLKPWLPPMSAPVQAGGATAQDLALSMINQVIETRQPTTFEWQHSTLDGRGFAAEVVLIPFMSDGLQQFCAMIQDITPRKQAEAFMLAAQQAAEAATQAKSRFLANMSHEIRTPMNAIMGMTHLALMDDMPPRARNYVEKAHRAAGSLLQILNDILDVSKIESGKLVLEDAEFQLETVVSSMADVLGGRAEEKRLELLFTAEPDIPTALIGDPMRLGQVLINLGTNAIKFTAKGEVIIGCEVHERQAEAVTLHFWVKDCGIGMSREQLDRLFEPFMQGDSSTTRQYGGTGLGLAICHQLVQLMGGRIWAESQQGKGSTFHFTAHFGVQTQASGQSSTRRALLAEELRDRRMLLVDDNPAAREVLSDMARRLGLNVEVADSGPTALRRMEQAAFEGKPHHLLLTDWQMPGMDGIEFAKRALALPPEHRPCVLLVTAFARDEALKAAEGVPLAGVLNKPVTPSTLLDTIGRALGQNTPAAPVVRSGAKALEKAQRHLAGARVLLVEDQPMNLELATDLLLRAGLTVVAAHDGQQALDVLALDAQFDGVLMDCQMPVMDGYETAQRIRSHERWRHLPIIAMTASAMAADRERVLASGMDDHITKPLDLMQMFTIMARWITPKHRTIAPLPDDAPDDALPRTLSLDTADGLIRCMGNLDLYRRLLKGFAKTQAKVGEELEQATQGAQWSQVYSLSHSLKGLSGNIGAHELAKVADALELAGHREDAQALSTLVPQVQAHLREVVRDIGILTQSKAPGAPQATGPEASELQGWWTRLSDLMSQHEAQARDVMDELLVHEPGIRRWPLALAVREALQRYDFDEATALLAQWQQQVRQEEANSA